MRSFIYKRTHRGGPDKRGCFGIRECMAKCRSWAFDAVIDVGGAGSEARRHKIDRKVNRIGIGPRRERLASDGSLVVAFDHFVLYNEKGRKLKDVAPDLARRMYATPGPRFVFSHKLPKADQAEITRLLRIAESAPPSRNAGPPFACEDL